MSNASLRPPFAAPRGPTRSDEELAHEFARGARSGYSPRLHIEGDVLVLDRISPVAVRLGEAGMLIRTDLSPPVEIAPGQVVDDDPLLATAVALQVLGLPASSWQLHGVDPDAATEALLAAAEDVDRPSLDT